MSAYGGRGFPPGTGTGREQLPGMVAIEAPVVARSTEAVCDKASRRPLWQGLPFLTLPPRQPEVSDPRPRKEACGLVQIVLLSGLASHRSVSAEALGDHRRLAPTRSRRHRADRRPPITGPKRRTAVPCTAGSRGPRRTSKTAPASFPSLFLFPFCVLRFSLVQVGVPHEQSRRRSAITPGWKA